MQIGDIIQARVTRIEPYGIWLEAEGRTGLLLIPDITYRRIGHPSEAAKVGDILRVRVTLFDPYDGHFGTTRKELYPDKGNLREGSDLPTRP
jgi:small subunit ribosomal protein S1